METEYTYGSAVCVTRAVEEGSEQERGRIQVDATCLEEIVDLTGQDRRQRHFLVSRLAKTLICDGMFLASQCK